LYSFGVTPKTLSGINNSRNKKIDAVINQVSDVLEDVSIIYDDVETISDDVETISGDLETISGNLDGVTTKVNTIEDGAQVNTIETITINGTPVEITDKTANIIIP
jgi:DNA anti-recombination protein RmuC